MPSAKQAQLTAVDLLTFAMADDEPRRFLHAAPDDIAPFLLRIKEGPDPSSPTLTKTQPLTLTLTQTQARTRTRTRTQTQTQTQTRTRTQTAEEELGKCGSSEACEAQVAVGGT